MLPEFWLNTTVYGSLDLPGSQLYFSSMITLKIGLISWYVWCVQCGKFSATAINVVQFENTLLINTLQVKPITHSKQMNQLSKADTLPAWTDLPVNRLYTDRWQLMAAVLDECTHTLSWYAPCFPLYSFVMNVTHPVSNIYRALKATDDTPILSLFTMYCEYSFIDRINKMSPKYRHRTRRTL